MRNLILQVQITVDGQIAGPKGEMDFMLWNWDDQLSAYVKNITDPVDCTVLGRKLAEGFIPHWATVAADSSNPEQMAGKWFSDTPKVVFSKTLKMNEWDNTVIKNGDIIEEIEELKKQDGNDLIVYGGATFVSSLIEHNLVDNYQLFVNPVAIGNGLPIFSGLMSKQEFTLIKALSFDCGIVVLNYEPKRK